MTSKLPDANSDCTDRQQEDDALITSTIQRFLAGQGPPPPHRPEEPYITVASGAHEHGQGHGFVTAGGPQYSIFFSQNTNAATMGSMTAEQSPPRGSAAAPARQSKQRGRKTKPTREVKGAGEEYMQRSLQSCSTDAILAQRLIPDVQGMRQGELVQGVGLLPSLRAEFMQKYEKPPKGRRAPREDLSPYTAEEKVERRKARARIYSDIARKREEEIKEVLKADIDYMRCFRQIVEDGPSMLAVLSCDLEAKILFANDAFARLACLAPPLLMGSPLWQWIHKADTQPLVQALTTVILTKKTPPNYVRCRLQRRQPDGYMDVEIALSHGTQGIVCTLWDM